MLKGLILFHEYDSRREMDDLQGRIAFDAGNLRWVGFTASVLYLMINDGGELLGFYLTPGKRDDRLPVPSIVKEL